MYEITLTDATTTATLPALEVPLSEDTLEGASDLVTLDMNVYTDFINLKRLWAHTWAYMDEADYLVIKGFYQRQFTLFEYPTVTITELGVDNEAVRMTLSPRRIIDNCGVVSDVQITLRETYQVSPES